MLNVNVKKVLRVCARNWPAKALSLAAALMLFLFNRTNTLDSRALAIPLSIENAGSLIAVNNYPKTVKITFRGPKNRIGAISESDLEASLDALRCESPGVYTLPVDLLKKGAALAGGDMEITASPWEVTLELDALVSKIVPVHPVFTGVLPEGYQMASSDITPRTLRVNGPESLLKKTQALFTERISLDGRTGPFSVSARIVSKEPLLELSGGARAEFTAVVQPLARIAHISGVPVTPRGLRGGLRAKTAFSKGSFTVQADASAAPLLPDAADCALAADCSGIEAAGVYLVPLTAQFPAGQKEGAFTVLSVTPESVEITISRED